MNTITKQEMGDLIDAAYQASKGAKCHISNYHVGAAILGVNGEIYHGFNIEFDNFTNTIHAEEAALTNMLLNWCETPIAIAVYTDEDVPWYPCGLCRQSLFEYGGKDLAVIACNNRGVADMSSMEWLMPGGFSTRCKKTGKRL